MAEHEIETALKNWLNGQRKHIIGDVREALEGYWARAVGHPLRADAAPAWADGWRYADKIWQD